MASLHEDYSNNGPGSKLIQSFLKAFPAHAEPLRAFVRRLNADSDVNRVPPEVLWKGMDDILETGRIPEPVRAPLVDYESSPEPETRLPTPCFDAPERPVRTSFIFSFHQCLC